MAPSTRASTKSGKKGGRGKKHGIHKKSVPVEKKPDVAAARCRFFELPPEIRNRVYHFAEEMPFNSDGFEPPLLIKTTKPKTLDKPRVYSGRKFFALTQTCKQIRSEFRPLWLRKSAVRIEIENLADFVNTYYPKIEDYHNAPRLLLISWDHGDGEDDEVLFNVTLLIRLRAHCSTFTAGFVSSSVAEGDLPNVECWECGHSIHCDCGIDCEHEDAHLEAWSELAMDYHYLQAVNEVLTNSNEAWLKAVREDVQKTMKVEFTFDMSTRRSTIYIRFTKGRAPVVFKTKDMYKTAISYLGQMGIPGLKLHEQLDFVVGEATGKYTRHHEGCYYSFPTYNQVHISGYALGKKEGTGPKAGSSTGWSL